MAARTESISLKTDGTYFSWSPGNIWPGIKRQLAVNLGPARSPSKRNVEPVIIAGPCLKAPVSGSQRRTCIYVFSSEGMLASRSLTFVGSNKRWIDALTQGRDVSKTVGHG